MTTATLGTRHWPVEVRLKTADKILEIDFDDGKTFRLPAEYLRVESPSAEVKGHVPSQRQLVAGRRHVGILQNGGFALNLPIAKRRLSKTGFAMPSS